jgi:hypothetical protein
MTLAELFAEYNCEDLVGTPMFLEIEARIVKLEAKNARLREALFEEMWQDGYQAGLERAAEEVQRLKRELAEARKDSAPEAGTLNHLRALKPGWNSYGAPAIDERAIRAAEAILRTPGQAVPTVHGGVQIEWHCDGVDAEFELGPDGQQVFEDTRAEEVQRLKRELAEARKDSARLDWFLASEVRDFGAFCEWHGLVQTSRTEASLDEWRAAIDAAMPPDALIEAARERDMEGQDAS